MAPTVSRGCGGTSRLHVIKVCPRNSTPTSTALAETSMADQFQAVNTRLPVSPCLGSVLPCRLTKASALHFVR